jgi:hypothetical protein
MTSMTFRDMQKYLEDLYAADNIPKRLAYSHECDDCHIDLMEQFGMWYCPECGCVDSYGVVEEFVHGESGFITQRSLYKRRLYFMEKIRSLCGHRNVMSNTASYRRLKKRLTKRNFSSIVELKQLLKEFKCNSYYKWLYTIWWDLKGTKLIELTPYQQDMLAVQFVEIDVKFKQQQGEHKRSNIMSYASVLYYLMKKNLYDGWEHIILPYNNVKIMRLIRSIDTDT